MKGCVMRRLKLLLGLGGLLAAAVLAPSASALPLTAPVVSTGTATTPTLTTTTVSGTVNPVGQATTYKFDYGTTTAYGHQTTAESAGSGLLDVPVTADLTGLTPATTYHFRVEATNASGPTDGSDATFTTAGTPVVQTGAATAVTGTTATLGGTVNPSGVAATYAFEYGPTTAYGTKTTSQSAGAGTANVTASAPITGLAAGTTYHYRLVATNADTAVQGADATFVTPGASAASKLAVTVSPAGGNTDLSSTLTVGADAAGTPIGAVASITQALSSQFANQLASFGT
jgi:phosphodiesterase/alkaline phosphatase D-like protein